MTACEVPVCVIIGERNGRSVAHVKEPLHYFSIPYDRYWKTISFQKGNLSIYTPADAEGCTYVLTLINDAPTNMHGKYAFTITLKKRDPTEARIYASCKERLVFVI